ncbi:MAG: DUF123 domain-containing protein [Promethearchaeota archaeon]
MNQGVYALIIKNNKDQQIQIGKLGTFLFLEGMYIYIGSALGKTSTNLEHRLKRHLSSSKKLFWHIDFLLNAADIKISAFIYAYTQEQKECSLSTSISQLEDAQILISNFGASDCKKNCGSHLFYFTLEMNTLLTLIKSAFSKINLNPIIKMSQINEND